MYAKSSVFLAVSAVAWTVPSVTLIIVCLLLMVALLLALRFARAYRAEIESKRSELVSLSDTVKQQGVAIEKLEREIARLRRIPKAQLLPMLQLAHELRSPLAAVQNALDFLLQGYATSSPELQDQMLGVARDRTTAMLSRVNDFMRLGAVQRAEIDRKLEPVQLLDVLQGIGLEMQIRAKWRAVELDLNLPDSLPLVRGTHEDMEHLLSNLISNAMKYTKPGGRVTVLLQATEDTVIGTVSDTGIGIPAEDLPRIFDEFYRAKEAKDMDAHGTGLGLAIVKRIVNLYDGELHVESELGKGSTFTFLFPSLELPSEGRG